MVVPVLMMSCQVSEYLKTGPVIPQIMITAMAIINAVELPVAMVAQLANRSNKFFFLLCCICLQMMLIQAQPKKSANVYHIGAFKLCKYYKLQFSCNVKAI